MIEIERKFLVLSDDYKYEAFKSTKIFQGFLSTNKERIVRVRIKDKKGFLTIKGKSSNDGTSRYEWEKEIKVTDAKELLKLCKESIIEKIRYEVRCAKHIFEVDEFLGSNKGLVVAEVELNKKEEEFIKPAWLGQEVTGDVKYYNSQISKHPYIYW